MGGFAVLTGMMLGEVSPGGVGSGLYTILLFAIIAVFIGGLRGRRLYDQAVRHARAERPPAGGPPPSRGRRGGSGRTGGRPPPLRPGPLRGDAGWAGPGPHRQGVRLPGLPRPPRREGLHPPDDP